MTLLLSRWLSMANLLLCWVCMLWQCVSWALFFVLCILSCSALLQSFMFHIMNTNSLGVVKWLFQLQCKKVHPCMLFLIRKKNVWKHFPLLWILNKIARQAGSKLSWWCVSWLNYFCQSVKILLLSHECPCLVRSEK